MRQRHSQRPADGQSYYLARNTETIPLTDDLFDSDSHCMVNLKTAHVSVVEKDTGRSVICNVEGYPYVLIWSAAKKPLHFICIEPWHSLPGEENGPWSGSSAPAAASLKKGESWSIHPFHHLCALSGERYDKDKGFCKNIAGSLTGALLGALVFLVLYGVRCWILSVWTGS